jgi:hypothetical protein
VPALLNLASASLSCWQVGQYCISLAKRYCTSPPGLPAVNSFRAPRQEEAEALAPWKAGGSRRVQPALRKASAANVVPAVFGYISLMSDRTGQFAAEAASGAMRQSNSRSPR